MWRKIHHRRILLRIVVVDDAVLSNAVLEDPRCSNEFGYLFIKDAAEFILYPARYISLFGAVSLVVHLVRLEFSGESVFSDDVRVFIEIINDDQLRLCPSVWPDYLVDRESRKFVSGNGKEWLPSNRYQALAWLGGKGYLNSAVEVPTMDLIIKGIDVWSLGDGRTT